MSLDVDYAVHLVRAEKALAAVYPAMIDRKPALALVCMLEVQRELANFAEIVIRANTAK